MAHIEREREWIDLLITDMRMPGLAGDELLNMMRTRRSEAPVIVITAFGSVEQAVEMVKAGAFQYLTKPFDTDDLLRASTPLRGMNLRRGDLLFFDQEGKKKSHVGIYLGGGRFVHAPSSGKSVRTDRLDSPYWKKHLSEARRI